MFKLSHGHPISSALDWRRFYSDLLRWARGINEIDRDSLKASTVLRAHLAVDSTIQVIGFREEDFGADFKEASGRRRSSTGDPIVFGQFPRVKLFVDSRELPAGHCIDYPAFNPQRYINETQGTGNNVPITFSGISFANLLKGKHLIDLDFVTPFDYRFEMINISITHFGW